MTSSVIHDTDKGGIPSPYEDIQSAVASEAAGVPWPRVDRPIWHREQDAFSGEKEEAANAPTHKFTSVYSLLGA